ncbi:HIR complex subunit [Cladophialophora chaetospira]|uniref:HIR complex subunit n=1 Tax=Cladophialophora chaetospira TaxID=386627 RepID=A0AA38XE34_9EURO|nr:HIR complex subunit [Cladophialophora chaetospira]
MEPDIRSSSNEPLSDVPSDYESRGPPAFANHLTAQSTTTPAGNLGVANNLEARQSNVATSATAAGTRQDPQPVKRPRKPRQPKDPNAPPAEKKPPRARVTKPRGASSTATTTASRKKTKVEPVEEDSTIHIPAPPTSGLQSSTLVQPVAFALQPPAVESHKNEAAKPSDSGFTMHDRPMHSYTSPPPTHEYKPNAPTPTPQSSTRRSTAMYDPIRGFTQRPLDTNPPPAPAQPVMTPPRPMYNPSMSPAISGIIDHPPQPDYPNSTMLVTHPPRAEPSYGHTNGRSIDPPKIIDDSSVMDVDLVEKEQMHLKKPAGPRKVPSEASTRQTSPKPARAKEQPPPPPMGSGLLSASLFGGDSNNGVAQKDSEKGPNIVLHVDLKDPENRVINFARLAEAKYGFAALYPRQAAQKERLAKIAAAGAALERSASGGKLGGTSAESGDEDLSVDIDRDSENDGDVAMSGVNGGQDAGNSGTDGPGQKRRRRRKVEEYDIDDDFVDDSEMLWEAQAAASKDGFFVYCGPLVPEGEKPAVERADGTIKRGRGRGRGGGPGSRGGRAAAAAAEGGSRRGGGPGSRGGGTTRKPRITKDERAQMEKEKLQREKMASLIPKPSAYPA